MSRASLGDQGNGVHRILPPGGTNFCLSPLIHEERKKVRFLSEKMLFWGHIGLCLPVGPSRASTLPGHLRLLLIRNRPTTTSGQASEHLLQITRQFLQPGLLSRQLLFQVHHTSL